jgi:hypothetical protein
VPLRGGPSDKLGNRFEGRWTARAVLDVLREDAQAIHLEPPGPDGEGVEFYVRFPDRIEFHQVKRQRTGQGNWTISALRGAGVLGTFLKKLGSPGTYCTFVSAHSAASLEELSDRARSARSVTEYERDLLTSKDLNKELATLKKAWGNPDPATVLDLLRRVRVETIGEDSLRRLVSVMAESILEGDQKKVIGTLVEVILDNVHKYLTPHDLWQLLAKYDYKPALWSRSQQAAVQVNAANARYVESRRLTLIQGRLIPRREADLLLDALAANRLVVLDGIAGMGKSDVLVQFLESLSSRKTPHLVFRLDRMTPTRRPDELGRELDLPASPTATLAAIAQENEAILIIDQLDAVSTTSGRNPQFLECVTDIVRSAHAVPNLRIVLVCRTFDIQNDARLRQLLELGKDRTTITVGPFERAQLQGPLSELGYLPDSLSASQLEILRTPLHLAFLAEATTTAGMPLDFSTPLDLYDAFWRTKHQSLRERLGSTFWVEVIDQLVDYMSRWQVLYAPAVIVDSWDQFANAMESEHVLTRDGRQLAFFHETFFDYAFARRLIARQGSISSLLAQDQLLFRRAQVRQILAHERQMDPVAYKRDLSYLVQNPSVRFHLREVVVSWLSQLAPTHEEWSLIAPLLVDETSPLFGRAWRMLLSPGWFKFADACGFVEKRLQVEDSLTVHMVSILSHIVKVLPERVAEILAPFVDAPRWRTRLVSVLSQADLGVARSLFDLFTACVEQEAAESARGNLGDLDYVARTLAKSRPDWTCELLGRYLDKRAAVARAAGFDNPFDDDANVFPRDLHLNDVVAALGSSAPMAYVEHIWPQMLEIVSRTSKELSADMLSFDCVWSWRHLSIPHDLAHSLISGAEIAFESLAQHEPKYFDGLVTEYWETRYATVIYLLYQGFSANATRYSDTAIEFLLKDQRRFQVCYSDSRYWATRRLLEAVTPHASVAAMESLELVLLGFYPTLQWEHGAEYGRTQFALLGGITPVRRSPAVQKRLAEFRRKFREADVAAPEGIIGGAIRSPIAAESACKMSDRQWLKALSAYAGSYRDRDRSRDFLKGGAEQLANVLEEEAKRAPVRFSRLALQFKDDTNKAYFEAVLRGVAAATEPLPLESTQALIEKCHQLSGRPCGRWIARPLLRHAQCDLPTELLELISWYAIHDPDPEPKNQKADDPDSEPDGRGSDEIRFDLINDGLNSVRGGVASVFARLVRANARHFSPLERAIRGLVTDRVAAVRAMAAEIICALVADHPAIARSLFLQLVEDADDRLLANRYVYLYLLWQGADDFELLRPIIERMIRSTVPSVRESGAEHATLVSLRRDDSRILADACLASDDESLRLGAAKVYRVNVTEPEYAERCSAALGKLFNDPSAEIRKAAGDTIWRMEGTQLGDHVPLARAFLESAAFEANVDDLVHALTETTAAVPELILETCERILNAFEANRQGPLAYQAGRAIEIVLRAYADTDERAVKDRALDLIDRSLKLDVYEASKLLVEHDRW